MTKSAETAGFGIALIKQTGYLSAKERNHTNRERYNHGAHKQGLKPRIKAPHKLTVNYIY